MWMIDKVRKYINSLLLLSIGILSLSLYFLLLRLPEHNEQVRNALSYPIKIASLEAQLTPTAVPKRLTESVAIAKPKPTEEPGPWGVAKQLDTHTWTMKIGMDAHMATPQELFDRLNIYRQLHSRQALHWHGGLATYAQSRAAYFTKIGKTDGHAGFIDYTSSVDNVKKLGFWSVGENSSSGYHLEATHLIEWVYAGDKPHDDNQLDSHWSHVGIGVDGRQTDFIFGGDETK